MKPQALIIRTAGTNCDRELAHAFELAGASTHTVHLNRLIEEPGLLDGANLIGVPGGFSYGDDISAGRIFANRLRHQLLEPLRQAIGRGVAVIGICNGFQVLVKLGLLPDSDSGHDMANAPKPGSAQPAPKQLVTLADNTTGRFVAKWVRVETPQDSACIWTRGLDEFDLPIAHGEGRFVVTSNTVLDGLRAGGQVALRYAVGDTTARPIDAGVSVAGGNPNGSVEDIAGICDSSGLVLGLMPHPERYTHFTNHPLWSRGLADGSASMPAGLRMFQNAVEHARQTASVTVAGG